MNNAIMMSRARSRSRSAASRSSLLGGNERADQRRQAIAKAPTSSSARAAVVDRAAKKKQIAESLAGSREALEEQARRSADPHRAGGPVDQETARS